MFWRSCLLDTPGRNALFRPLLRCLLVVLFAAFVAEPGIAQSNGGGLPNFTFVPQGEEAQTLTPLPRFEFVPPKTTIEVDLPPFTVVGKPDPEEIIVDLPPLVIVGAPEPESIVVDLPPLTIVGRADPEEIIVDLPLLVIVGKEPPETITVELPPLTIVGRSEPEEIEVDLPLLTIVGREEEDNSDESDAEDSNTDIGIVEGSAPLKPFILTPTTPETPEQPSVAQATDWCNGVYQGTFSRPVAEVQAFVPLMGQAVTVTAQVAARQCGDVLNVTMQGIALDMVGDRASRTYSGTLNMGDGAARVMVLTCGADLTLTGALRASENGVSVRRDIVLTRSQAALPDFAGCEP